MIYKDGKVKRKAFKASAGDPDEKEAIRMEACDWASAFEPKKQAATVKDKEDVIGCDRQEPVVLSQPDPDRHPDASSSSGPQ